MRKTSNLHRLISEANMVNGSPVEESFVHDLERTVVLEEAAHSHSHSSPYYKPSSMQCMRTMYYQVTGTPKDQKEANVNNVNFGESGEDRHKRIQYFIKQMAKYGMQCEFVSVEEFIKENGLTNLEVIHNEHDSEFETLVLIRNLNLRFKCDGIIKYRGSYYVLEIKTEVSFNWQKRNDVSKKHIIQGCCYSYAFKLDNVIFLYENRDICSWKAYLLTTTPEMRKELVLNRIYACEVYREKQHVPPIQETQVKGICQFCDYCNTCRRHGQTEYLEIDYEAL